MIRDRGGGSSRSEVVGGAVDRKRINDALDKHLEKSSPSTSRVLNLKEKERLSVPSTSSAGGGKSQHEHRDNRALGNLNAKNKCSDEEDMSSSSEIALAVKSCDGDVVYIKETVALQSLFMQRKIKLNEAGPECPPIDLELINTATLNKVVHYCNYHAELANDEAALDSFDAQFVKVDERTLFTLIHAAHYLKIYTLMNLTCQTLSSKFKGKNMEEAIRNWRDNGE